MSNNHHTPIPTNASANASTFNTPLGQLDQAIDTVSRTNNLTATTDPTVNDDTDDSYSIGSFWLNTTNNKLYIATDVTFGAAVWVQINDVADLDIDSLPSATPTISDTVIIKDVDDANSVKEATIGDVLDLVTAGGLVPIANVTLGAAATSISFTSIPGTYAHLRIVGVLRSDRAATSTDGISITFNSDTGANYGWFVNRTSFSGAATNSNSGSDNAISPDIVIPAATADANMSAILTVDIPAYADTTFIKNINARGNAPSTIGAGFDWKVSGRWNSTVAITRIDFAPLAGTNFITGSRLTLYGMVNV